jgi:hypothetical protein
MAKQKFFLRINRLNKLQHEVEQNYLLDRLLTNHLCLYSVQHLIIIRNIDNGNNVINLKLLGMYGKAD